MKKYCTQSCIDTYFKDNAVFGMKTASLSEMTISPTEHLKSSNDFKIFVSVNMTPSELSVFDPSETFASFYIVLMRQPNGNYLIDNFVTG